ncbi:MAG: hypothetical protein M4579_006669 [Chaenotheca gracillima]|nr:MAG: hypothetical protein M4579_006669 [Chaenotheca gracillima]
MRPFLRHDRLGHPLLRQLRQPQTLSRLPTRRSLVAAPRPGSGPLMDRRGDRELPDLPPRIPKLVRTLPIFIALMTISSLFIFNYQKSSSSVVASTLYALRTSERARKALGNEVYFAHKIPWIWGELNQLHGRIDISFRVKGTKGQGMMRFESKRPERAGSFKTYVWSLEMDDGTKIQLLEPEGRDPLVGSVLDDE